jgi:hypothetical protein
MSCTKALNGLGVSAGFEAQLRGYLRRVGDSDPPEPDTPGGGPTSDPGILSRLRDIASRATASGLGNTERAARHLRAVEPEMDLAAS